jgi:hypothetical protein
VRRIKIRRTKDRKAIRKRGGKEIKRDKGKEELNVFLFIFDRPCVGIDVKIKEGNM